MLIASKSQMQLADEIAADIPVALRHDDVVMHAPVEVARRARAAAAASGVDGLVSVGGGSTTGLAKAVARAERRAIVRNNVRDFRPLHVEAVMPGGPGHFGMSNGRVQSRPGPFRIISIWNLGGAVTKPSLQCWRFDG